jgi:autotransporter passenger strand-loop-strand repeat protein
VVASTGLARSTTVSSGGTEIINRGTASGTIVSGGGIEIVSGGIATSTTVSSSATVIVSSGGTASSTIVSSGGTEIVSSGGIASSTIVNNGGTEIVKSGGSDHGTIVSSGGSEIVSSGGHTGAFVINGGTVELANPLAVTGAITFGSGGGTLRIDGTSMPGAVNPISGLAPGEIIDLPNVSFVSGGTAFLTPSKTLATALKIVDGTFSGSLSLAAPFTRYSSDTFRVISDGQGGIEVVLGLSGTTAPTGALVTGNSSGSGVRASTSVLASTSPLSSGASDSATVRVATSPSSSGLADPTNAFATGLLWSGGSSDGYDTFLSGGTWSGGDSDGDYVSGGLVGSGGDWDDDHISGGLVGSGGDSDGDGGSGGWWGSGSGAVWSGFERGTTHDHLVFSGGDGGGSWLNNGFHWDDGTSISGGTVVGFGDFDHDGKPDLLFSNTTGGFVFESLLGSGAPDPQAIGSWQEISGSTSGYSLVGVGDVSGGPDLLYRNDSTGGFAYKPLDTSGSVPDLGDLGGWSGPWAGADELAHLLFDNGGNSGSHEPTVSGGFISGGTCTAQSLTGLAGQLGTELSDLLFRTSGATTAAGTLDDLHDAPGSSTTYKVLR